MHHHWSTETFVSSYINMPIVIGLYFGYKYICKTEVIPLDKIPIRQFLELVDVEEPKSDGPKSWKNRLDILWS